MEIEGQYLTYSEYQELGGTLDQTPFNLLEFEARKQIDLRTQGRLIEIETENIPSEVKLCTYKLINEIQGYANSIESANNSNGSVASENTDGYSISYNQINATQIEAIVKSKNAEFKDIIISCLSEVILDGERLIFMGV